MPQISRQSLKPEITEQLLEILTDAIAQANRERTTRALLDFLLTPTEKTMVAKRVTASLLLTKGANYEDIKKAIHLSQGTIAKIKLNLKSNLIYQKTVKWLLKDREVDQSFLKLTKMLGNIFAGGSKGGNFWWNLARGSEKEIKNKIV